MVRLHMGDYHASALINDDDIRKRCETLEIDKRNTLRIWGNNLPRIALLLQPPRLQGSYQKNQPLLSITEMATIKNIFWFVDKMSNHCW